MSPNLVAIIMVQGRHGTELRTVQVPAPPWWQPLVDDIVEVAHSAAATVRERIGRQPNKRHRRKR
jgi:hypothetical protein